MDSWRAWDSMLPYEVESMLPTEPERLMESGFEVIARAASCLLPRVGRNRSPRDSRADCPPRADRFDMRPRTRAILAPYAHIWAIVVPLAAPRRW